MKVGCISASASTYKALYWEAKKMFVLLMKLSFAPERHQRDLSNKLGLFAKYTTLISNTKTYSWQ
ncbi:hypothetical protein BA953_08235 [Vibrio coralliilyticus]|nr:hypothetical protein BA953_08235 [Vibrio coralliilyticus]